MSPLTLVFVLSHFWARGHSQRTATCYKTIVFVIIIIIIIIIIRGSAQRQKRSPDNGRRRGLSLLLMKALSFAGRCLAGGAIRHRSAGSLLPRQRKVAAEYLFARLLNANNKTHKPPPTRASEANWPPLQRNGT